MAVAVAEEDFSLAAKLRDESKALTERLSPVQQFQFAQARACRRYQHATALKQTDFHEHRVAMETSSEMHCMKSWHMSVKQL